MRIIFHLEDNENYLKWVREDCFRNVFDNADETENINRSFILDNSVKSFMDKDKDIALVQCSTINQATAILEEIKRNKDKVVQCIIDLHVPEDEMILNEYLKNKDQIKLEKKIDKLAGWKLITKMISSNILNDETFVEYTSANSIEEYEDKLEENKVFFIGQGNSKHTFTQKENKSGVKDDTFIEKIKMNIIKKRFYANPIKQKLIDDYSYLYEYFEKHKNLEKKHLQEFLDYGEEIFTLISNDWEKEETDENNKNFKVNQHKCIDIFGTKIRPKLDKFIQNYYTGKHSQNYSLNFIKFSESLNFYIDKIKTEEGISVSYFAKNFNNNFYIKEFGKILGPQIEAFINYLQQEHGESFKISQSDINIENFAESLNFYIQDNYDEDGTNPQHFYNNIKGKTNIKLVTIKGDLIKSSRNFSQTCYHAENNILKDRLLKYADKDMFILMFKNLMYAIKLWVTIDHKGFKQIGDFKGKDFDIKFLERTIRF